MSSHKPIANPPASAPSARKTGNTRNRLLRYAPILAGIGVVLIVIVWVVLARRGTDTTSGTTYTVRRGPLVISVLESGSVKALKSQQIKSEVEGQTTIISLVPEGTIITDADVKAGKVLVELDSSDLRDRLTQQEITFQGAEASYTQAKESYAIQKNQNDSNIKSGELKVKFAKMDLDKYLGTTLVGQIVESNIDFQKLANSPDLGGEALQQKRQNETAIDLAREEVSRANDKLDWTQKLFDKGYVSQSELEADALAKKRRDIDLEQAQTALDLFLQYEFPKQVEKLLSDYTEASKELERIQARARSELAQSEAQLKSGEARYELEKDKREKLKTQIEKCVIRATQPGMVVYAGQDRWGRTENLIEEGATVRERQDIIQIPDIAQMAVEVKVHESAVDKVKEGIPARITVDAFPDLKLEGKVLKVALMPDQQSRWLNPELKVYNTDVSINGNHRSLKPGMSAKCEIMVNRLENVLAVPIQAVTAYKDQRVCYVLASTQPDMRVVETGEFNDKFIEIRKGLKEGDRVLLHPPKFIALKTEQPEEGLESAAGEQAATKPTSQQLTATTQSLTVKQAEPTTPSLSREELAQRRERMSPQQREEMRKRFENMSPEERDQMMQQFRRQRESSGDRQGRPSERRPRPSDQNQGQTNTAPRPGENP
jgi:HlyD family secretion protein